MDGENRDDVDELHAQISKALLACSRCITGGRISQRDLVEVAKLLTAAQEKLGQWRTTQTPGAAPPHRPSS